MNKEEIFKKCIERWGKEAQIFMAIEEASELIQALIHHWRNRKNEDEMMLMCEQLALIFGEAQVSACMDMKLIRLQRRVADENRKIIM
jgi:hypothetical protein